MSIQEFLKSNAASPVAIEFSNGKTLKEVWETCQNADWLMWLIRRLDFPAITFQELAFLFAKGVLHLTKNETTKNAVAALRRWLDGEQMDLNRLIVSVNEVYEEAYNFANYSAEVANYAVLDANRSTAYESRDAIDTALAALRATGQYNYYAEYATIALLLAEKYSDVIQIMRKHIPFDQVAQAARKKGIDC